MSSAQPLAGGYHSANVLSTCFSIFKVLCALQVIGGGGLHSPPGDWIGCAVHGRAIISPPWPDPCSPTIAPMAAKGSLSHPVPCHLPVAAGMLLETRAPPSPNQHLSFASLVCGLAFCGSVNVVSCFPLPTHSLTIPGSSLRTPYPLCSFFYSMACLSPDGVLKFLMYMQH